MRCYNCGAEVGEDIKFCRKCGTNLILNECPKCGVVIRDGLNFCPKCGYKLINDDIQTQKEVNNNKNKTKQNEEKPVDIYKYNNQLLKEKGLGFINRASFESYMGTKHLNMHKDIITQELLDELTINGKLFSTIYEYNMQILKDNGIGGFFDSGGFSNFMKTKGLDMSNNIITQELLDELTYNGKVYSSTYNYNKQILKDMGFKEYTFTQFMKDKKLEITKNKITPHLIEQFNKRDCK